MSRISKIIEEYGIDPNGKNVIKLHFECDTVSDLPTTAEAATANIVMALGSDAHIIQDDTKYMIKGDGSWVKQKGEFELSLDAAAIDYDNTTSGMAADNIQDAIDEIYAATETQGSAITDLQTENTSQQNEIDYAINTGAKNYLLLNQSSGTTAGVDWTVNQSTGLVTATRNSGTADSTKLIAEFDLKAGDYIFTANQNASFSTADAFITSSGSTIARDIDGYQEFTLTQDATIRISCRLRGAVASAEFKPMIRRAEITSNTFEPYAPTNRELYEMILQLQSAAGLRTVSTLRSAAAPLENEIEEEVIEDEER